MFDYALTTLLIFVLPAYQLWRSLVRRNDDEAKIARYRRAMIIAGSLFLAVMAEWLTLGRTVADLGLKIPISQVGVIGLGIAAILLTSIAVLMKVKQPKEDAAAAALFPATTEERRVFIAFSLIVGAAWEVLYRGYLLWMLSPLTGTAGAVAIAATAYGIAHGFKEWKTFAASLASAVIFTAAYALTRSLWWLMLIHAGLPLTTFFLKQKSVTSEYAGQPL